MGGARGRMEYGTEVGTDAETVGAENGNRPGVARTAIVCCCCLTPPPMAPDGAKLTAKGAPLERPLPPPPPTPAAAAAAAAAATGTGPAGEGSSRHEKGLMERGSCWTACGRGGGDRRIGIPATPAAAAGAGGGAESAPEVDPPPVASLPDDTVFTMDTS